MRKLKLLVLLGLLIIPLSFSQECSVDILFSDENSGLSCSGEVVNLDFYIASEGVLIDPSVLSVNLEKDGSSSDLSNILNKIETGHYSISGVVGASGERTINVNGVVNGCEFSNQLGYFVHEQNTCKDYEEYSSSNQFAQAGVCTYSGAVQKADKNGDRRIDNNENIRAYADWQDKKYTSAQYFEIQDYWVNNCGATANPSCTLSVPSPVNVNSPSSVSISWQNAGSSPTARIDCGSDGTHSLSGNRYYLIGARTDSGSQTFGSCSYQNSGLKTVTASVGNANCGSRSITVKDVSSCANECSFSGQKSCQGNNVVTCGNYDSDSCLEWGSAQSCPSGATCSAGACVSGSGQDSCTDPDSGVNEQYTKASVRLQKGSAISLYGDKCNLNVLTEYYCIGTSLGTKTINCVNGCQNGACIQGGNPTGTCTDTDNGKNLLVKGTVTSKTGAIGTDRCDPVSGNNWVREYWCTANGDLSSGLELCPSGNTCNDGRCVPTSGSASCFIANVQSPVNVNQGSSLTLQLNNFASNPIVNINCGSNGKFSVNNLQFWTGTAPTNFGSWVPGTCSYSTSGSKSVTATANGISCGSKTIQVGGTSCLPVGRLCSQHSDCCSNFCASGLGEKRCSVSYTPKVDISIPQSARVNSPIQFTSTSENADTFEWVFGDGNSEMGAQVNHIYSTEGTYNVLLAVKNSDGDGTLYLSRVRVSGDGSLSAERASAINVATLTSGWNMFYLNVDTPLSHVDFKRACSNALVLKLESGKLLQEVDSLESGKAYLVRTNNACEINAEVSKLDAGVNLESGWNLVGISRDISVDELENTCKNALAIGLVDGKLYTETEKLLDGESYLIRVGEDCSLLPGLPE